MSYFLFLDDERDPRDVTWGTSLYQDGEWIIVRTVEEMTSTIYTYGLPALISFDHDLGENQKTGYDAMKLLVKNWLDGQEGYENLPQVDILVHSQNPVGAKNIKAYWDNFQDYHK